MNQPMIPEQRRREILRMLRGAGVLSTRELTEAMNVSHMTIRRDIAALEVACQVVAVQGGVRLCDDPRRESHHRAERPALNHPSEQAIATAAATWVRDSSVIFLDAGSTCQAVVSHLSEHSGLTVVTNDFSTVAALKPHHHINVIHCGGLVARHQPATCGPLSVAIVQQLAVDLYLMSAGTWGLVDGVTVPDSDTALLKRAVMAVSHCTVMLADSSTFGTFEHFRVAQLGALDAIVTDDGLPADAAAQIDQLLGPQLECVPATVVTTERRSS